MSNESGKEALTVVVEPLTASEPHAAEHEAEKMRFSFRESLSAMASPFAARPRLSRVTVLTLAIALSAAAGSAVGAMAAVALAKPDSAPAENVRTIEVNNLRGVITQLSAEVASLKAAIDGNAKSANTQMAKIADRVERAEKAHAEPASRVAKLSEMLERIDRRTAAAPAPAAVASVPVPAPAAASSAPEITGSIAQKQQDRPAVLSGWVIHEVFRGRAMVENDRFGLFEVVPGAKLPGIGRVDTIRREDGRWIVVTPKGLIVSSR